MLCTHKTTFSASLDYFVTNSPPYLHQFSTISGGNCITKTATEQIVDIKQTLRYLGVPIKSKAYMFGDNKSVVTSSTVPHSLLSKRHNILSYHRVREAITAKILVFHWCDSSHNKSDILSKYWEFSKIFCIIRDLFDFQGKISLIQQEH